MVSKKQKCKAVIFGADGLLGKEFASFSVPLTHFDVLTYNKKNADITDRNAITDILSKERPDIVINCAVLVNLDRCEKSPLTAWNVNALGAGIVAQGIRDAGLADTSLVHISTSDVFGGPKKRYTPADAPAPVNVYGWSKYGGEKIVEQIGANLSGRFYIIRVGWLYGAGRNTLIDMVAQSLRQQKPIEALANQYNIPVWTRDLVTATWKLTQEHTAPSGIYHIGTPETKRGVSKYEIALEVARILKLDASLIKKSTTTGSQHIKRPEHAVLAHSLALQKFSWKKSLAEYLKARYN